MREYLLYIDGAWRSGGAGSAAAISPSSGETFATVAVASPVDVDDAVRAAAAAWPEWAGASAFERAGWFEQGHRGHRGPAGGTRPRADP